MQAYGGSRFEAFISECRSKLPKPDVDFETTVVPYNIRNLTLVSGNGLKVPTPGDLLWKEPLFKDTTQKIIIFNLEIEQVTNTYRRSRSLAKETRGQIRNFLGKDKTEFLLPEPATQLPAPPWLLAVSKQWCFTSEAEEIVRQWADTTIANLK